jgi:hypothetical protein
MISSRPRASSDSAKSWTIVAPAVTVVTDSLRGDGVGTDRNVEEEVAPGLLRESADAGAGDGNLHSRHRLARLLIDHPSCDLLRVEARHGEQERRDKYEHRTTSRMHGILLGSRLRSTAG